MFYSSLKPAYDVCRVRGLVQPDYLKSGACILLPGAAVFGFDADEHSVTLSCEGQKVPMLSNEHIYTVGE